MSVNDAKQDSNQFPTLMALSGTLASTYGTATTIPLTATADGKLRVESAAEVTIGTISAVNTIGTLNSGTVTVNAGADSNAGTFVAVRLTDGTTFYNASGSGGGGTTVQFDTGTVTLLKAGTITKVEGGTIGLVTRVGNVGTLEVGTISAMPNIPGGTIGVVSSVGTVPGVGVVTSVTGVASGTINNSGTTTGVGVVSLLTAGTVTKVEGGTISVSNLAGGTVSILSAGTVNVNPITGQVGIAAGVGVTGVTVPRVVVANGAGRTLVSAGGAASSSGDNTIVAAGTGRLKVYGFTLTMVSTTAVTCIFKDGAAGTELWRVVLQAPTGVSVGANLIVQPPAWIFATSSATLLNLNLSAAVAVNWSVAYYDEA